MNFDFSATVGAKEAGNRLTPGIKNCIFNGIDFSTLTSQKTGDTYKILALNLSVEGYGDYTQNFFEPTSNERTEGNYGMQPSQLDHFLISVREILEALDPQLTEDLDNKKIELKGTFKQIVDTLKKITAKYIGTEVEVKFIPQSNGFCSIPSYPARITRNGDLGIATRFIGHDLVLNANEQKKIENAQNAAPTNMASKSDVTNTLNAMAAEMGDSDSSDDLPF